MAAAGRPTEVISVIQTNASPTLDGLFKRILARKPDAPALLDPINKQRITGQPPRNLTFARSRPGDHGAGGAFHRIRAAVQFRDRGATAQYRRVRADGAGRASRRPGGGAVPAAVAAGGTDGRAQSHRGAGDREHEPDRRRRAFRSRHECRRRSLFDPPCLRFRQRPAGRHGFARSGHVGRLHHLARRGAGRPQGGDHLVRRHQRRLSSGAAHASEFDRRRPRAVARKRRAAGLDHHVGVHAVVVRGPDLVAGDLAVVRRNAGAASSVRRRRARAADRRAQLRHAGRARATGVAAGRDRHGVASADPAHDDRPVARAGTGRIVSRPGRSRR